MDRRGPARLILALFVALASLLGPTAVASASGDAPPATEPATQPSDDLPVPTVSDFYPEDNNLSDCVGLVERPGCGSEARGGWRQVTVFAVLIAGLALIFWRISVGVRRNRRDATPDAERSSEPQP